MTETEKQAFAIYEEMCVTSRDHPFAANFLEAAARDRTAWSANDPSLSKLRRAPAEVRLAFLKQSFEFLRAEAKDLECFSVATTIVEGIRIVFFGAVEPIPSDIVHKLLSEFRQDHSMARLYFPFKELLSVIIKEQVTEEIRAELRRFHALFSPSATGKIDEDALSIRERVGYLMRVEGDKELEPGRGPWSQIIFDAIAQKDEVASSGWKVLLEHCRTLTATTPSASWKRRSRELMKALGEDEAGKTMLEWLALGPAPGQPAEARSPIEDSSYQKGIVWSVALVDSRESAVAIGDFAVACLRKIKSVGAVSQKVGLACAAALGTMKCDEAVSQLTRLRIKIKYSLATRLIEKSLEQAADRAGLSREELEDICVPTFGLDAGGEVSIAIADAQAIVSICNDERVRISWRDAHGKLMKSPPSHLRKAFPNEVRNAGALAKEIEQTYSTQRARLESSLAGPRSMPAQHWQKYFLYHPILGLLGKRLIWIFSRDSENESSGIWMDSTVRDAYGKEIDVAASKNVRLWHPLSRHKAEVQAWRERILACGIRQPFRQAFREIYELTDAERQNRMYSNRFAGMLMRQHQFASLCRARGWNYRLMGVGFDGSNAPQKNVPLWNIRVAFYVELPPDRDPSLRDSALNEQSGSGINAFVGSDQVCFYRDGREIELEEVPATVYSEVMRDVDLFTSVCAVGEDETWSDQGDRGVGIFPESFAAIELRREILVRTLPMTLIADRCTLEPMALIVKGQLGTYRIELAAGTATIERESIQRVLNIPRRLLDAVPLNVDTFPVELDYRTEIILRKAHILADDWKIDSRELVKQLMPE